MATIPDDHLQAPGASSGNSAPAECPGSADVEVGLTWRRRMVFLATRPTRTFQYLAERPDVVTPLAGVAAGSLVMSAALTPGALKGVAAALPADAQIPNGILPLIGAFTAVFSVAVSVMAWLASSLIVYLAAKALTGRGNARAAISILGYASLPSTLLQNVMRAAQVAMTGHLGASFGLAAMMAPTAPALSRTVASNLTLPALWTAALSVVGVSTLFHLSRTKSLLLMSLFWSLSIAAQVVMAVRS